MTARTRRTRKTFAVTLTFVVIAVLTSTLAACSGSKGSDLTGKTWQAVSITEKQPAFQGMVPPDQQANYTILFKEDGNAEIRADCNSVGATWKTGAGASLNITLGPSTLMACPEGSMADQYLRSLGKTVSYGVEGSQLKLTANDAGQLEFEAKQ